MHVILPNAQAAVPTANVKASVPVATTPIGASFSAALAKVALLARPADSPEDALPGETPNVESAGGLSGETAVEVALVAPDMAQNTDIIDKKPNVAAVQVPDDATGIVRLPPDAAASTEDLIGKTGVGPPAAEGVAQHPRDAVITKAAGSVIPDAASPAHLRVLRAASPQPAAQTPVANAYREQADVAKDAPKPVLPQAATPSRAPAVPLPVTTPTPQPRFDRTDSKPDASVRAERVAITAPIVPSAAPSGPAITLQNMAIVAESKVSATLDVSSFTAARADIPEAAISESRSLATPESNRADHARQMAEVPRAVLVTRQVAEAARFLVDRPVELQLNPEELGRVRMMLTREDGGLNVVIAAERSETLELMRRNIDMLAEDFRNAGYSDFSFDFAFAEHAGQSDEGPEDRPEDPEMNATDAAPKPVDVVRIQWGGGLDLRL